MVQIQPPQPKIKTLIDKKLKGDIAETKVLAKLTSLGFGVSIPYGDRLSYDLVLDVSGKLLKIQVKSTYYEKNSALVCSGPRKTLTNRRTIKYSSYSVGDFDFMIAYSLEEDIHFVVPSEIYLRKNSSGFRLREGGKQRKADHDMSQYLNAWHLLK